MKLTNYPEIVQYMLASIPSRQEIFNIALDRGRGEGMHIEKWMLIEMLARLKELKDVNSEVEGEHKYRINRNKIGCMSIAICGGK